MCSDMHKWMRPHGLDTTDRTLIPYYVDSNTICLNENGSCILVGIIK